MDVITPFSGASIRCTPSRTKAQEEYDPVRSTPFLDRIPGEIRNYIYEYCLIDGPIDVKISPYIRAQHKGQRSLTQVSPQIRMEFLPLYSKNPFQHTYSSAMALKKFLQRFLGTFSKNSKIKIVILFKWVYSALDFLRIFKLIDATRLVELEVSFRCEGKHSTIAEAMNRAIQQKSSWQGSISQVKRISLYRYDDTRLTVHLVCYYGSSRQDRDERKNASDVWSRLGFAVR